MSRYRTVVGVCAVLLVAGASVSSAEEVPPVREKLPTVEPHAGGSLGWFARHQEADGRWDAARFGGAKADVSATGLALLSFLGTGHTEKTGKYTSTVSKAVAYLISKQNDEGCIGAGSPGGTGYNHAIAGLALSEAYGMARVPETGRAAQAAVDYSTRDHQAEYSGWGAAARGTPDMVTTAWFVCQLKSSTVAGLKVDARGYAGAAAFIDKCTRITDDGTGTPSVSLRPGLAPDEKSLAAAMLAKQFMGYRRVEPALYQSANVLMTKLPAWGDETTHYEYWYFGTLAMFQMGGDWWRAWNGAMRDMLVAKQRRGIPALDGSWDPIGAGCEVGGRVQSTALASLCLETYYRYLPVYGEPGGPAAPTVARGTSSTKRGGEDAISDIPLGGTSVVGCVGVGGGGAGAFGYRGGGGRRRAALRGGGSPASEAAVGGGTVPSKGVAEIRAMALVAEEADGSRPKKSVVVPETGADADPVPDAKPEPPKPVKRIVNVPRLKGGSRDDNDKREGYMRFRKEFAANYAGFFRTGDVIDVDVSVQREIVVRTDDGKPLANALVRVSSGGKEVLRARTYADGTTLYHPKALTAEEGDYTVSVVCAGREHVSKCSDRDQTPLDVELDGAWRADVPTLDLLFCIDTTGSMGDEIRAIQSTLADIVERIHAFPGEVSLRLGLVEYRDRHDEYVTRVHDFTTDVAVFQGLLSAVQARGGGDTPESVNEALDCAVNSASWTEGPSGVRLVVLVADAAPHMDYPDDVKYDVSIRAAHGRGIKIYPVAASGLSTRGEYIFRQCAQYTSAKFLFITYGGGTPHDVKPFKENNLDDIVVGIVRDELSAYRGGDEDAGEDEEVVAEDAPADGGEETVDVF